MSRTMRLLRRPWTHKALVIVALSLAILVRVRTELFFLWFLPLVLFA